MPDPDLYVYTEVGGSLIEQFTALLMYFRIVTVIMIVRGYLHSSCCVHH